jgi:hypothetical protein
MPHLICTKLVRHWGWVGIAVSIENYSCIF